MCDPFENITLLLTEKKKKKKKPFSIYTGWRSVVVVFLTICFPVNDNIVLSGSIFWLNKLRVNVGILLIYFLK